MSPPSGPLDAGVAEVDDGDYELLSPCTCLSLLAGGGSGRLALTVGALPTVVPVGFVVTEGGIVVAGPADPWFRSATEGVVVAFEVDHADTETGACWSVVVVGIATALEGMSPAEEASLRAGMGPWAAQDGRGLLVIAPGTVSGRWSSPVKPAVGSTRRSA
jgi:hypothetical protein